MVVFLPGLWDGEIGLAESRTTSRNKGIGDGRQKISIVVIVHFFDTALQNVLFNQALGSLQNFTKFNRFPTIIRGCAHVPWGTQSRKDSILDAYTHLWLDVPQGFCREDC